MRLDPARQIHAARIDFDPVLSAGVVRTAHKSGSAHIGNGLHRLTRRQAVGDFDNRPLGIAIQEQITFGIDNDGAAHFVAPVIVMCDAAQTAFDTTQNNGHVFKGFAATLAIDDGRAIGPLTAYVARCVGIITADLAIGGVAVDHGVHIAAGHTPKQIGFAQGLEGCGAVPVWLGDDAHAKALGLQHATDNRHTKAGVVHIGITGDQDNIAAVPAQLVHLGPAHGQKGRGTKARGPVLAVAT